MKLEDLPDSQSGQYPERLTVCTSTEVKQKIDLIRAKKGKKTAVDFLRKLIEDGLKDIAV